MKTVASCSMSKAEVMSGSGYLFFTVMSFRLRKSMHGRSDPSFFPTKKKPAATGDDEGLMIPVAREPLLYLSIAERSGLDIL